MSVLLSVLIKPPFVGDRKQVARAVSRPCDCTFGSTVGSLNPQRTIENLGGQQPGTADIQHDTRVDEQKHLACEAIITFII